MEIELTHQPTRARRLGPGWYGRTRADLRAARSQWIASLELEIALDNGDEAFRDAYVATMAKVTAHLVDAIEAREYARATSPRAIRERLEGGGRCILCLAMRHAGGALCSHGCENDERTKMAGEIRGRARTLSSLLARYSTLVRSWDQPAPLTFESVADMLAAAARLLEDVAEGVST